MGGQAAWGPLPLLVPRNAATRGLTPAWRRGAGWGGPGPLPRSTLQRWPRAGHPRPRGQVLRGRAGRRRTATESPLAASATGRAGPRSARGSGPSRPAVLRGPRPRAPDPPRGPGRVRWGRGCRGCRGLRPTGQRGPGPSCGSGPAPHTPRTPGAADEPLTSPQGPHAAGDDGPDPRAAEVAAARVCSQAAAMLLAEKLRTTRGGSGAGPRASFYP